jgi:hypothetical protein
MYAQIGLAEITSSIISHSKAFLQMIQAIGVHKEEVVALIRTIALACIPILEVTMAALCLKDPKLVENIVFELEKCSVKLTIAPGNETKAYLGWVLVDKMLLSIEEYFLDESVLPLVGGLGPHH